MSGLIVVLDVQHAGKPKPHHLDRGATARDERGRVLVECELARAYAASAARYLAAEGIGSLTIDPGGEGLTGVSYSRRHERVRALALGPWAEDRVVYVACHLNSFTSPDPDYALTMHDQRSQAGRAVATEIAAQFDRALPVSASKVQAMTSETRGYSCIGGIYAGPPNLCAVLLEPLFLSNPAHQRLLTGDGPNMIGAALVDGLLTWWRGL